MQDKEIGLVGLRIDRDLLDWMAGHLAEVFEGVRIVAGEQEVRLPSPNRRGQYSAEKILASLPPDRHRTLAVVDQDLTVPAMNFVFGLAQPGLRRALIALPRLRETFYGRLPDRPLFYSRVLKEAVHELGHTFGLRHCPDPHCVMHFSNTLRHTDEKSAQFCPNCLSKLRSRIT